MGPGDEKEDDFENSGQPHQADVDAIYDTEGLDVDESSEPNDEEEKNED